jgi:cell shape-determining protein MreC
MKSSYRHISDTSVVRAGAIGLVCIVIVFAIDGFSGGRVRSYVRTFSSVAWGAAGYTADFVNQSGYFSSRSALARENRELSERLALFEEQSARYHALEMQNDALRAMVSLVESDRSGQTARVLSSFRTAPYGTFVIAAGERDGIARGDIVLTSGGFALGRITDLDAHTATVHALFAPGATTEVVVRDVAFSVDGRGGGNAYAEIPRGAGLALGDAAIVPEYGGRVAGLIGSIESASSSATEKLYLRLPHNLDTLRFVYVVPAQ